VEPPSIIQTSRVMTVSTGHGLPLTTTETASARNVAILNHKKLVSVREAETREALIGRSWGREDDEGKLCKFK